MRLDNQLIHSSNFGGSKSLQNNLAKRIYSKQDNAKKNLTEGNLLKLWFS